MATSLAIATEASEAPTPVQTPAAGGHLPSGTRLALGLLVVSTFVVILNETIMSVALASVGGTGTTTDHRLPAHDGDRHPHHRVPAPAVHHPTGLHRGMSACDAVRHAGRRCQTGLVTRAGRLSALDAIFLPMETTTQSLHVRAVLVLEGPARDVSGFREHVVASLAGVPIARRRVMRMPLDLGRPRWVDAEDFDPASHLHHVEVDAPGDEPQLRALVARIMGPRLDADRPLWELWQVDGLSGGRWAVVVKAHHTMVDGRSGADLVASLLTRVPDAPLPRASSVAPLLALEGAETGAMRSASLLVASKGTCPRGRVAAR
ncbi:MAG: wax ester/triacylglycerol synthase domain-containing protein [Propionicimonas sp.]